LIYSYVLEVVSKPQIASMDPLEADIFGFGNDL
jgi:hypothetical protein